MGLRWLAVALFVALTAPSCAAGIVGKQYLTFGGRDRIYNLYVPDAAAGPRPLVVLLHGSGGNGLFMIRQWQDLASHEGIVLLAPDSAHTDVGWDLRDDGPDFIRELVTTAAASAPVDPRRIYLFGQSGGAVYALTLAMLESEYFAAVAFHAGGWRHVVEYKAMDYARRKLPIAMFVGDRDEYFSLSSVETTERVLTDRGFPAELHLLPGRVHSYLDVPPDFHDTVWAFLKRNALSDPPRFTSYRMGAR